MRLLLVKRKQGRSQRVSSLWDQRDFLAAQHASNINSTPNNLSFVSCLFGPRYSLSDRTRMVPFGQFLLGGVHGFDASFPNPESMSLIRMLWHLQPAQDSIIDTARHFAVRATQADYFQTHLPNDGNNRQNHLRRLPASSFVLVRKPSADDSAWILRPFGASGQDRKATLIWPSIPPPKVWLSDLGEQPVAPAQEEIPVAGWGVTTLRIDRA